MIPFFVLAGQVNYTLQKVLRLQQSVIFSRVMLAGGCSLTVQCGKYLHFSISCGDVLMQSGRRFSIMYLSLIIE